MINKSRLYKRRTSKFFVFLCIVFLFLSAFIVTDKLSATEAGKQTSENLLLILDCSGSMWGRVEGREKIVIAKEVMKELIAGLPKDMNVGLVAYGHRRKGDCKDIELIVPLGTGNRKLLLDQIDVLKPKGKTPLSNSLEVASEHLKEIKGPTTIVLVSDGKETCGGDPCALTRNLIVRGINFRLHVVGFDVTAEEKKQLLCMAETGGGEYFDAQSVSSLRKAITTVSKQVVARSKGRGFIEIELTPSDVGSTSSSVFSTLPTTNPAAFGLTGKRIGKVNFDKTPDGKTLPPNTILTDQYASIGVTMNGIKISDSVYQGPASPPNATTSPYTGGFSQIFTFSVPVVAVGVINTSPDQDRIEFWTGPEGKGTLLHSFIDQVGQKMNYNVDRFIGGRTVGGDLIGSIVLKNNTGQIELDELIFEIAKTP